MTATRLLSGQPGGGDVTADTPHAAGGIRQRGEGRYSCFHRFCGTCGSLEGTSGYRRRDGVSRRKCEVETSAQRREEGCETAVKEARVSVDVCWCRLLGD